MTCFLRHGQGFEPELQNGGEAEMEPTPRFKARRRDEARDKLREMRSRLTGPLPVENAACDRIERRAIGRRRSNRGVR